MEKSNNVSFLGKIIIIVAAILAIIMVNGTWLDLYQVPMIFGNSIEHEYTLFEITDFIDTFNMYLDNSDVSAFTGILTAGAVITIILNAVLILLTILNSNAKKAVSSLAIVVSIALAVIYLGAIAYINSEMKEVTYGGIEELLRSTSNPYWLVAFSVLSFVGTNIKKTVSTGSISQIGQASLKTRCLQCGAEIDKSSSFCNSCGAAVVVEKESVRNEVYCTQCGAKVDASSSFCTSCGNKI